MINFDNIQTLSDIKNYSNSTSSSDGESLYFEKKGTNGTEKFVKDQKKLLAPEICALANTYGGSLCFHNGDRDKIKPFSVGFCKTTYNSLEGWLRDTLNPRSLGIQLKVVDGVFLIHIPESNNKPHRASTDNVYYYRHNTQTEPMPEIMVASMYRSQDYLDFTPSIHIFRTESQLNIHVTIKNNSNIAGSKPKIHVQIFSNIGEYFKFPHGEYLVDHQTGFIPMGNIPQSQGVKCCGRLSTNSDFSNQILYPQDKIILSGNSTPNPVINKMKYVAASMYCVFKESAKKEGTGLFQIDESQKSIPIEHFSSNNLSKTFHAYKELTKNNDY